MLKGKYSKCFGGIRHARARRKTCEKRLSIDYVTRTRSFRMFHCMQWVYIEAVSYNLQLCSLLVLCAVYVVHGFHPERFQERYGGRSRCAMPGSCLWSLAFYHRRVMRTRRWRRLRSCKTGFHCEAIISTYNSLQLRDCERRGNIMFRDRHE